MRIANRLFVALLLGLLACTAAHAATAPAPPNGLTGEQFDAVVDAASRAVLDRLGKTGVPAKPSEPEAHGLERSVSTFVGQAKAAFMATPELGRRLASIPGLLLEESPGRGLSLYLFLLALTVTLALSVESLLRRGASAYRERLALRARDAVGLKAAGPLLLLAALDAVGLGAVWLVSYGAVGIWFPGNDNQARLARGILIGLFDWRLYMLAFRTVLRPNLVAARMATLTDEGARLVYSRISLIVLLAIAVRVTGIVLAATGASADAEAAFHIYGDVLAFAVLFRALHVTRGQVGGWFAGSGARNDPEAVRRWGTHWLMFAVPFFLLLFLTLLYGALTHRASVPEAMIRTMNLALALAFFETIRTFLTRSPDGGTSAVHAQDAARNPLLSALVLRCLRVAVLIVVGATVIQTWIVGVFGLIDAGAWRGATHASVTAGGTLFGAFVAWELVRYATARYVAPAPLPGTDSDEALPPSPTASRLATLAPLMRVVAATVITIIATLVVLTELGVNITPLIAGASVFGLAVSFGSQTLVKDIVSGMFYLADDAFRVGEYIDCGKAKGTVEGFTLRSVKLRHQNGQIHTIPFGQLGQITNFSRDWATVKFNLRLARNTDLEKTRKTVKKVGQAMLEDPEVKNEFLEPVKLQGIAEVLDNALVVRVKFTVKPQNPSFIQRLAIKRIIEAFAANGIEFVSPTVAVQTVGVHPDITPAAGAAVTAAQARNAEVTTIG